MPDVPDRCPLCDAETLYKGVNLYHACGSRSTTDGTVVMEGWSCTVMQRDAARAEAERWRREQGRARELVELLWEIIESEIPRDGTVANLVEVAEQVDALLGVSGGANQEGGGEA